MSRTMTNTRVELPIWDDDPNWALIWEAAPIRQQVTSTSRDGFRLAHLDHPDRSSLTSSLAWDQI